MYSLWFKWYVKVIYSFAGNRMQVSLFAAD